VTTVLKPIRELINTARIHPASALPTETHQSYPIPVHGGAGDLPGVAFLYAPSQLVFGQGLFLYPPGYRALILARDGHFQELRSMTPADVGLSDDPTKPLGTYGLPPGVTRDAFIELKERLLTAYDELMPAFFDGGAPAETTVRTAKDFRAVFDQITERILDPYYRAVGRRFFAWLDATAA
jgi:hypothetical protein